MNPRVMLGFGIGNVLASVVVLIGVFQGLPARWLPIDGAAAAVAALLAASGAGLVLRANWAPRVARAAAVVVLAIGLVFVAALALTASYLSGIYGPVGKGGALIFVLVAALALPYLVVLPASQLVWLTEPRDDLRRGSSGRLTGAREPARFGAGARSEGGSRSPVSEEK
jgi:hypothetical protein